MSPGKLAEVRARLEAIVASYSHALECNTPRSVAELGEISACAVALREPSGG